MAASDQYLSTGHVFVQFVQGNHPNTQKVKLDQNPTDHPKGSKIEVVHRHTHFYADVDAWSLK